MLPILLNQVPDALGIPLRTETVTHLEFIIFGSLICYLLIKEPHGFARLWSHRQGEAQTLAVPLLRTAGQGRGDRNAERRSSVEDNEAQNKPGRGRSQ